MLFSAAVADSELLAAIFRSVLPHRFHALCGDLAALDDGFDVALREFVHVFECLGALGIGIGEHGLGLFGGVLDRGIHDVRFLADDGLRLGGDRLDGLNGLLRDDFRGGLHGHLLLGHRRCSRGGNDRLAGGLDGAGRGPGDRLHRILDRFDRGHSFRLGDGCLDLGGSGSDLRGGRGDRVDNGGRNYRRIHLGGRLGNGRVAGQGGPPVCRCCTAI
nr:hypothetical protein [Sphingomonas aliaeris]